MGLLLLLLLLLLHLRNLRSRLNLRRSLVCHLLMLRYARMPQSMMHVDMRSSTARWSLLRIKLLRMNRHRRCRDGP